MENPNQQTRIRMFWLEGFRPAMVIVASLLVLGTAVPVASAAPPEQHYKFMTVDAPGKDVFQESITWINNSGLITQQYFDVDGYYHAAALLSSGWTVLDVTGAPNTTPTNPNSQGQVALASFSQDDWLMSIGIWQRGNYTSFSDSAWEGYFLWNVEALNDRGQITGSVANDADGGIVYGWVADSQHHTVFSYPGSDATWAMMTNNSGTTVGWYLDADGITQHGFIKDGDHFVSVDYPGGVNTSLFGINNAGDIAGMYRPAPGEPNHGFLLQRGQFTPFDVPGAVGGFDFWITDNKTITGTYRLSDGSFHGFIAIPVGGK
jgi:hypothetical protein